MRFFIAVLFCCFACNQGLEEKAPAVKMQPAKQSKRELTYPQLQQYIDSSRTELKIKFKMSDSAEKRIVLLKAKDFFVDLIVEDLFAHWQGTPWDFNGVTEIPKQGKIACGYFVTTILRDLGVHLNRIKLAQMTSMSMMRKLTSPEKIINLSPMSYDRFVRSVEEFGKSCFIIGLDYHTGFIVNDGQETWFVHSNYIYKVGVVKEKLKESTALKSSKTRFITNLTDDDFLKKWLLR